MHDDSVLQVRCSKTCKFSNLIFSNTKPQTKKPYSLLFNLFFHVELFLAYSPRFYNNDTNDTIEFRIIEKCE